jgi:hypothetical protein
MATKYRLTVESGVVSCPRFGDVDVERCAMCSAFAGLAEESDHLVVRCRPRLTCLAGLELATEVYGPARPATPPVSY